AGVPARHQRLLRSKSNRGEEAKMPRCRLIIFLVSAALFFSTALCGYAGNETIRGKLVYYEYDAYPYGLEVKKDNVIALDIPVDKNYRNQTADKMLGKIVQVTGPARVITAKTELQGLKIIDVGPGKGTINLLR
ncbi:MAG: hypothetical protein MUP25_04675, partial [Syntrophales bacterium]|nr:hypothetical protein [Syntrophales bacterium]